MKRVMLAKSANSCRKGALKFYSAIVQFFLKRYVKDDHIERSDVEGHNFIRISMLPAE